MGTLCRLLALSLLPGAFATFALGQSKWEKQDPPIPTVDFCDMVKHPATYFDQTIRLTATMEMGDEGSNLNNVRCVRSHDDSIGVGSIRTSDRQVELLNQSYGAIRSGKFSMQPQVTVIGILRNQSLRSFAWYRYRFDIIQFEYIRQEVSETIVSYTGSLVARQTYRAMIRGDQSFGLMFAFFPVRNAMHQALSLEWANLKTFPDLQRLRVTRPKANRLSSYRRRYPPNRTASLEPHDPARDSVG